MDLPRESTESLQEAVTQALERLDGTLPSRTIPARTPEGELVVPESLHVLDAIARSRGLVDTDELMSWGVGTVAVMDKLPDCDRCGTASARYDVISPLPACWSCETCFRGSQLGMGKAQRLMTYDEVPADVREVCEALTTELGRRSVFE